MSMNSCRNAGLALSTTLLLACATPQDTPTTRLPLVDRSTLLVQVPRAWTLEPSFAAGPRLALLRINTGGSGAVQLRLEPRLEPVAQAPADMTQLRMRAQRELQASGWCDGVAAPQQERAFTAGLAVLCTRPKGQVATALLPATAGVLVTRELTVRFAFLELDAQELAAAWALMQSLDVQRFALTY